MDDVFFKDKKLLIVDDESDLREIIASEFEFLGARVFQAENVKSAQSVLAKNKIDLIISDIRMPGESGIDLVKYVKSKNDDAPPIILITGFADVTIEDAFEFGAEALMNKPFKLEDLIQLATKLLTPITERYIHPDLASKKELSITFNEDLKEKIHMQEVAIGRGGISLTLDSHLVDWSIGEKLNFDLKYKDIELNGRAICRWCRSKGNGQLSSFGFEFTQLTDATYKFLLQYWQSHKIIPFIPELH